MKWDDYIKSYAHLKLFLKGLPGTGKSYLAASASRLGKTLIIDTEGGIVSAAPVVNPDNLEIDRLDFFDASQAAQKFSESVQKAIDGNYDFVILDSFSEFSGALEDQYSKGNGDVTDWMKIVEKIKKAARFLRDGDFHTIITCHMKGKDYDPILPGSTSVTVPGQYGIVAMTDTRKIQNEIQYTLVTQGFSSQAVRDRFRILDPIEVISPTNPEQLLEKMVRGIKAVSESSQVAAV